MLEHHLIAHSAPTLAHLKTANLFQFSYTSEARLREELRRCRRALSGKGVFIQVLRRGNGRALLYVFRPTALRQDLREPGVTDFLALRGYPSTALRDVLPRLCQRLRDGQDFPHEIGLFLGYPLTDVLGFIENQGKNCKCAGCWKVYGDESAAQKSFARYKACQRVYETQFQRGRTLAQLTVSSHSTIIKGVLQS